MITELVLGKMMCLFEMEDDAMFDALTDQKNGAERFGAISRDFEFYVHDPNGAGERFYMTWSATFNPRKRKYEADDRQKPRLVETRAEIGKGWISRRIEVTDPAKAVEAARWVVENNGCVVLPANPKDELRIAVMRALFYITFPEREIDAPGGLLRGYQLPGRMVRFAIKKIRYDGIKAIIKDVRQKAKLAIERKRRLVVDTLLGRAANAVAVRNGIDREEALRRIEGVGGRTVIETAPDLSLAIGFEHRLGLDGGKATAGRLVQTAQITPLRDSVDTMRFCREVKIKAKRVSAPRRGTEGDRVAYSADTVRIMRDEGNYYLLAIPKYARYKYGRDLLFAPGSESVAVHTYRNASEKP